MPFKPVVTVSVEDLNRLAAELWDLMLGGGFRPDAVVGIATGGVVVVESMRLPDSVTVMSCQMRRPSSDTKDSLTASAVLRRLPYPVADLVRNVEDVLHRRREPRRQSPGAMLSEQLDAISEAVQATGLRRVAVVDDAVDSGVTLDCVVRGLRDRLPAEVDIRSAALTVTRPPQRTLVRPDYHLYDLTLLRFPWSLDFKGTP